MRRGNVFKGDMLLFEAQVDKLKVQPPDGAGVFRLSGEIHLRPNETLAIGKYLLCLIERDNRSCDIEVTNIVKDVAYFNGSMIQP